MWKPSRTWARGLILCFALGALAACGAQKISTTISTTISTAEAPHASPNEDVGDASNDSRVRGLTVLAINDVYRVEGVAGGSEGGVARVRTLRRELEQEYGEVLMLHAGDALYPSLASRVFHGAQMIEMLNLLDGGPEHDDKMFFVFGNHEFDDEKLEEAAMLNARMDESQFDWLDTNLVWTKDPQGRPWIRSDRMRERALLDVEGVRVGLFGLVTDFKHPEYVESFEDYLETARRLCRELREEGAEVVIALTHLTRAQDDSLLDVLGDEGPDLVIGGHEHQQQKYEHASGRKVIKASADAVSATVARILVAEDGSIEIRDEWRHLDDSVEPDPLLKKHADRIMTDTDREICAAMKPKRPAGCLDEKLARAEVELVGDEMTIRRYETNLGNWIIDLARAEFASRGAQVAFVNSGSLRLNRDVVAGEAITQKIVEETFAYPAGLVLFELTGATLQKVAEKSVSAWTGEGHFLQISGFAFRHDPKTGAVDGLTLLEESGPRPILPEEKLLAVTSTFLMTPEYGQDGYSMLDPAWILPQEGPRPDLKDLVVEALNEAPESGVKAQVEGRICVVGTPSGPCLAFSDGGAKEPSP